MTFAQIMALLQANQNEADWGHIEIDNVWIAYCLADVNLRLEFRVTWQKRKPFMSYQLNYSATPILAFSIPVMTALSSTDAFNSFVQEAPGRLSNRPG